MLHVRASGDRAVESKGRTNIKRQGAGSVHVLYVQLPSSLGGIDLGEGEGDVGSWLLLCKKSTEQSQLFILL